METNLVRPHLGKSPEERIELRRRRLLDTAFEILADDGWKKLTINNLCRRAKLSKRYFYESFPNLDEVAAAIFDELASTIVNIGFQVARKAQKDGLSIDNLARLVLEEIINYLADDPRRARVLFTEIADSPRAVAQRKASINGLAQTLNAFSDEHYGVTERHPIGELGSALLIGGSIEAILAWLHGNIKMSREQFVEYLAALWVIVGNGAADLIGVR
jgi:AcrR family transcriptional regulator